MVDATRGRKAGDSSRGFSPSIPSTSSPGELERTRGSRRIGEPFHPTANINIERSYESTRRYCWCMTLLQGSGDDGPRFATCSYCWPSRKQDTEDYRAHREWFGRAYPGDDGPGTSTAGCAEHGLDHPHIHCVESQL
jgi:hypothetical protein